MEKTITKKIAWSVLDEIMEESFLDFSLRGYQIIKEPKHIDPYKKYSYKITFRFPDDDAENFYQKLAEIIELAKKSLIKKINKL